MSCTPIAMLPSPGEYGCGRALSYLTSGLKTLHLRRRITPQRHLSSITLVLQRHSQPGYRVWFYPFKVMVCLARFSVAFYSITSITGSITMPGPYSALRCKGSSESWSSIYFCFITSQGKAHASAESITCGFHGFCPEFTLTWRTFCHPGVDIEACMKSPLWTSLPTPIGSTGSGRDSAP